MGGAKNCPETPRQRMIAMMYLVLTAMLALNVSTDILNGFRLVDDSLHFTLDATNRRNQELMDMFNVAYEKNPQKTKEWYDKAQLLQKESDNLYNYLQNFKHDIAVLADGAEKANDDPRVANIESRDNLDVTSHYALAQDQGEGKGIELRKMFEDYRELLIRLTDGKKKAEYEQMFSTRGGVTNDGDSITWEEVIFDGMPVGASITILTKMQNDVRSAQSEMIQYLLTQTDASDYRVNNLKAFVIPQSTYVMKGGQYTAQIVLSAVDSTAKPKYYINNSPLDSTGIYRVSCNSVGTFKYKGQIQLPSNDDGELETYNFESEYTVGEPSATMSNVELNVIYRGYDNKFSISVPGVPNDKVKVTANGATVSRSGGMYIIKPTIEKGKVTITAQAELNGKMITMGSKEYRLMPLPKPGAFFSAGDKLYDGGNIPRNTLLNGNNRVVASFGQDALLDLKYKITSFKVQNASGQLLPANGDKFTQQQIAMIQKLKQGAPVNIVDIKAVGPDGRTVTLRGLPLTVN